MIEDADGTLITSLSMSGAPGDNVPFALLIECKAGYKLKATSPDSGVVIWAKANIGDAFQNIQTTPIDLTPYATTIKTFYFECRIGGGEPSEILVYQILVEM